MLTKFKKNFFSLIEVINKDDLFKFLLEKEAFKEEFIDLVVESNELTKLTNVRNNKTKNFKPKDYIFDITKVDNDYQVGYDKKLKKITVNISGNTIFSYYDDEKELRKKLDTYVNNEEYEKAKVIHDYMKKCHI